MLKDFQFHDKLVLRTTYKSLHKETINAEELKKFFNLPDHKEALFLASPHLYEEFMRWQASGLSNAKNEAKLIRALLKYHIRMRSRSTPFGLFAGCGLMEWGDQTELEINAQGFRKTRLDMHYSVALAQHLATQVFIKPLLVFKPNTSLYRLGEKVRYVEYFYKNKSRIHQISSVENSEYLEAVLQRAKGGANLSELAQSIVSDEVDLEDATYFIEELVQAQLLVSNLEPSVTGKDLLDQILEVLHTVQKQNENAENKEVIAKLEAIRNSLLELDKKCGNALEDYQEIIRKISELGVAFEKNKLFQTDYFLKVEKGSLQSSYQKNIGRALTVLRKLLPAHTESNLNQFKENFIKRYGNQELSLAKVLDTESGIGYASKTNTTGDLNPLVDDLMLPLEASEQKVDWTISDSVLLHKLTQAYRNNRKEVHFTEKDVELLKLPEKSLPDSLNVMLSLGGTEQEPELFLKSASGSSAANLLGRFAGGHTGIKTLIEDITQAEAALHKEVLAEVVHLPESRVGNVLMRPSFRGYEIPYLSKASTKDEGTIEVADLYVSVHNNRVVLRSKKLNKEVLPRMSNAHNYSFNALPIYHFLCDLQSQDQVNDLFFSWGHLQEEFRFLPRVIIHGIVVSPAKWNLYKQELEALVKPDPTKLEEIVTTWRKQLGIPAQFLLVEGDNKLLVNANCPLHISMFMEEVKGKSELKLEEFTGGTSVRVNGESQLMSNEFVATLQKKKNLEETAELNSPANKEVPDVAENWLYFNIYCGPKTADELLREIIPRKVEEYHAHQLISRWFFIRYADPDLHLRVRFLLNDIHQMGALMQDFRQALQEFVKAGKIARIRLDSYEPEYDRYGVGSMAATEQLFFNDSVATVMLLQQVKQERHRWIACLYAVHRLFLDFDIALEERKELMRFVKEGFAAEFRMDKQLRQQLSAKYREEQELILRVLTSDKTSLDQELLPLLDTLEQRSEHNAEAVQQILALEKAGELEVPFSDFVLSHIHMIVNRVFRNKQRLHELVLYDFLWRSYDSQFARQKKQQPIPIKTTA